jgi:hypothetical protein
VITLASILFVHRKSLSDQRKERKTKYIRKVYVQPTKANPELSTMMMFIYFIFSLLNWFNNIGPWNIGMDFFIYLFIAFLQSTQDT